MTNGSCSVPTSVNCNVGQLLKANGSVSVRQSYFSMSMNYMLLPRHQLVPLGFKVLKAMTMKTATIFWNKSPCNPIKFHQHFGGTY
jgi:hypothetical protein